MAKTKEGPSPLAVFVEKAGQLTRPQRILICIAAFAVLGVGFYFLAFQRNMNEISDLSTQVSDKLDAVRVAKLKADKLEAKRKERKEAEGALQAVAQLLPKDKEIPELLSRISKSGYDAGLEWLLFQPQAEVDRPEQAYTEMPMNVEVAGDYHGIASFFDKVAHLPRIVNIVDIKIEPSSTDQGGWKRLAAKCRAVTYRFLDPGSIDEKDKNKGKDAKK